MSEQVIIDGELSLDSAFDGLPNEQIVVNVTGAPKIIDKASGKIVSIVDGAEKEKLLSAVVNIEPVQDLHGYDYPWPGGGGVNMAHLADGSRTGQGCTGTVASEVISVSGTASATYVNATWMNDITIVSGESYTVRLSKALTVDITFRFATDTTDTTYQQVSVNAGYTSAVFTANNNFAKYRIYVSGITSGTAINISDLQILVGKGTVGSFSPYSNISPISGWSQVNVWVKPTYDTTLTPTATIPLGQTVYGGTLDVLRGKLILTHAYWTDNGTANWAFNADGSAYVWYMPASPLSVQEADGCACNYGPYEISFNGMSVFARANGLISLGRGWGSIYADVTALKAAFAATPIQIVYKLATPIEVDLTPQTIKTLKGTNNIWADAGSMEVEYVADTKLYIQRLTAPTEDDMIANENISSGMFFMVGNDLYLSTAAIVAGETIAPGTNCTKLSLAEALNNINA